MFKSIIKLVAISLILVLSFSSKSQISYDNVLKGLHTYVNNDSLKGFDEIFHKQYALQNGFFGVEYNVYMHNAKKSYLINKYGLQPSINLGGSNAKPPGGNQVNAAPCVNEDFEAGTFAGWTVSQGQNVNVGGSCTMAGCCPNVSTNAWIRTTPWAGPLPLGTIPASPLGGTRIAQLNDMVWNTGEIARIQQTFPVTPTNALFQFAYMAAMDGSGHACCDQPFMKITLLNCNNQPLACPSISITPPGASCVSAVPSGWTTNTSGVSYTNAWQIKSLDLTPYIGTCVTIQVTVGDCTGWAHAGMAYFDAVCKSLDVTVNNVAFPAGSQIVYANGCGVNSSTVSAPPGLGPYTWTGPAGSGIVNNPNQTITTTVTGNYTLVMNPVGSCAPITKTVNLTFGASPTSGFTNVNSCNNYTFTNTGSSAPSIQTYSFIGVGAPPSYTTTTPTSSVVFNTPGTYTIQQVVTNTIGCTSTSSIVVNIPSGPTLTVNSPSICPNSNANLNVSGANTYTWTGPNLNNISISNPIANPLITTTYTVSGSDLAGCISTNTTVVTVLPTPTITVNSTTMCIGSTTILTANGGSTYTWSPGTGLSSTNISNPNASPLVNTNYTVSSTAINGCVSSAISTVVVNPLPILSTTSATTCAGVNTTISASGANTYIWSNGSLTQSITVNPFTQTTYTVIGTSVSGCTSTATSIVYIAPPLSINISNNAPICQGGTLVLTAPSGYTYNWNGPNGFTSNSSSPSIIDAQTSASGVYQLTAIDINGCTAIASTNAIVNPNPIVSIISSKDKICAPGCITFTCNSSTNIDELSWFFQNGTAVNTNTTTQCFNKGGIYTSTATIIDNNGCIGSTTNTIEIYASPIADFISSPLRPIENEEVHFTDASYGAPITEWYWFFNSQIINSTLQNPYAIYEPGTYPVTLIVKTKNGCVDTITKIVNVGEDYGIYIPNSFTPNGDGLNDTFQPKGFGIVKYELKIFDRWGEELFHTNDFSKGWDGKVHKGLDYGIICKDDVYVWKINLTNVFGKSHELKGHITLIK